MAGHKPVTFNGWLTFCYWCRLVRMNNAATMRRWRRACPRAE